MTLLLREVGRFLVGAAAWIGFEVVIAAAVASTVGIGATINRRHAVGAAFLGAIVLAAAAVRVSAPLAWAPIVGGRPLPVIWSVLGAVIAAGLFRTRLSRTAAGP